ncbi:hypothetical protein BGZ89_004815, partial [Linnemannia elongata]
MLAEFLRQSMKGMKAPTEVYPLITVVTGASIGGIYMASRKLVTDPHLRRNLQQSSSESTTSFDHDMRVFEEERDNYLQHFHDPALRGPVSLDKQYLSSQQALAIDTGLQAQKRLQLQCQTAVIVLPLCSLLCLFQLSPP